MTVESKKNKVCRQMQLMPSTTKERRTIGMRKEEKEIRSNITKNRPLTVKL
jgi:hypothetical protein